MDFQNKNNSEKQRDFFLSTWSVDNRTSIFILTIMILLFGYFGYRNMPKEQFPEVELPTIYINTPYFGNSAADIENLVTREIEKELQGVEGVKNIKSTSLQDYSVVIVEFEAEEDIDAALDRVKDAVDIAKSELPNDLDADPFVTDVNLSKLPIMSINISGDYSNDGLREYAEYLEDKIEQIDQISEVELKGTLEREVKVDLDLYKMESRQVSYQDVENAISSENITLSGGEILNNGNRRAIRVVGEFESVNEIEDLIVKSEDLNPVYLREIAAVTFGYKERTSIARSDGLPVISLDVIKRSGENLLYAADNIKATIEEAKKNLPDDLSITLFNDQSNQTRDQVNNLENSIISGVILVVLVLLFFLGLRNASFVGLAIPLSMLMGILILAQTGVTMNVVVLFALILALGLLVDNGIVVVENVYRYMQEGYSPSEAAKYGAGEVALPIIASTATTLAAFAPLAFWPGLIGEFMFYMPFTLIIILASSLFVALSINPVFTASFMKIDEKADNPEMRKKRVRNSLIIGVGCIIAAVVFHFVDQSSDTSWMWARNLSALVGVVTLINFFILRPASFSFQNSFLPWLENVYDKFVKFALRIPGVMFGFTILLLIGAFVAISIRQPQIELFPSADPLYVNAFIELPLGTDIEETNNVVASLEQRITEVVEPYSSIVESVLVQIGENTADPMASPEPGASPQKARVTVSFVTAQERGDISTVKIMNEIRDAMQGYPGVKISVDQNANGPATGKPINLEVQGEDIDKLVVLGSEVISYFNSLGIPGVEELQADIQVGKPELMVNVDREEARRYGLSTYQIASAIRTSVYGREVSQYKEGEDEYPIFVRLDEKYRNNISDLLNQRLIFRNNVGKMLQIPISSVATAEYTSTYSSIKRKDLDRVVTIYSNVVDGYNATEIVNELKLAMEDYDLPQGFTYQFTGEQEEQAESMSFLVGAFGVAVFAILIILVTQFNSIYSPIIIILTVLFSTIGVFFGYAIFGGKISVVFTGVGIVSLAGIVVNNAIVLIDYINLLVKRKRESKGLADMMLLEKEDIKESIIRGGATRLRPVLLTAITTILGLVPLAIGFNINFFTWISRSDAQVFIGGDNAAFWGPMAWTVIYGLVFATFLTLVIVPVMYWLAYRFKAFTSKTYRNRHEIKGSAA